MRFLLTPNVSHTDSTCEPKFKVCKPDYHIGRAAWAWHWWRRPRWRRRSIVVYAQPVLLDSVLLAWGWFRLGNGLGVGVPSAFWLELELLRRRSSNTRTDADVRAGCFEAVAVHRAGDGAVGVCNPRSIAGAWIGIA